MKLSISKNSRMNKLILLGVLSFSIMISSQIKKKVNDLECAISFKKKHVIFECSKGCNYSFLSFDADRKVFLNENAMVNGNNKSAEQSESNFLVLYCKKGKEIYLKGIKGVEWKNITLNSDLNLKYLINQKGEIKKIIL